LNTSWQAQLKGNSVDWLLEAEPPGVRFLALRDLLDADDSDSKLRSARKSAHKSGPIARILNKMEPAGYWVRPGPGYTAKYRSAVWSLTMLAQLGASADEDKRIQRACAYILDHALIENGRFTATGTPSGGICCLQGNLCWALMTLGYDDPRLKEAFDWMARLVTGEGIAPAAERRAPVRYCGGDCGPDFACAYNEKRSCAWGAVKVMLAFGSLPTERRTPIIQRAMQRGVDFLLGIDPALAAYPTRAGLKPSREWWKFGFPVFYVTDLLQIVEAMTALGLARDPRLSHAVTLIREKQDVNGRWALDHDYAGKTWVSFGAKRRPNKWVTLRALRVLKAVDGG
jgi:hypothetical protein